MKVRSHVGRWPALLLVPTVVALALVTVAVAEAPKVHLTADGQAAARAVVLRKADLAPATGWTGGLSKSDLSDSGPLCPNFEPKQSDLVVNGAAESQWTHPSGLTFFSQGEVLQTAQMVRLDWQRSVLSPKMLPCVSRTLVEGAGPGAQLISATRLKFPQIATYATQFRVVIGASGSSARAMIDTIFIGNGRTEITLMASGPFTAKNALGAAEIRLARILVSRIRA